MNCIYTIFDRPAFDNIADSLGNMIVSGVNNDGRSKALQDLLDIQLRYNRTTVILQDAITSEDHSAFLASVMPAMHGKKIYDVSLSADADKSINILSAFNDITIKTDFIMSLFSMVAEVPEALKNKIHRLFYYAMDTYDRISRPYKLIDLMHLDLEEVADAVESAGFDEFEKKRRLRFLSDSSTYASFIDIESYMIQLESAGICKTYSGDVNFYDALNSGNMVLVNGYAREDKHKRELLINSFLMVLSATLEQCVISRPCSVLVKNIDFAREDVMNAIMEYNGTIDCAVYALIEDISRYIEKNGNELLDRAKSFLVFTQGSDANAAFWSSFFGSRDVQERSFSYTKRKGWNPFSTMMDSGGVIASPRKYNSTTTSIQKVNKPIYRTEIFRELRPNEVMCYLREPLIRRKSRVD